MNDYEVLYDADKVCEAYNLSVKNFLREEIFDLLKSENDIEVQIGLINLQEIKSEKEAEFLLTFLTNNPGPVRELCSEKIKEFFLKAETKQYFAEDTSDILIKGLCDVIPAVAGNIAKIIHILPNKNNTFDKLVSCAFEKVNGFKAETDPHEKNRLKFALYRILEALFYFSDIVSDDFKRLLEICADDENYTIREKTAKIISRYPQFIELNKKLSKDDCFYVRKILV